MTMETRGASARAGGTLRVRAGRSDAQMTSSAGYPTYTYPTANADSQNSRRIIDRSAIS
jgi:hypothetical protein